MNASITLQGHGLVYAFNLTIKENKFYFYFEGKEDVLSVYNVGGTEFFTLVISYNLLQLLTKQNEESGAHIYHLPSFQTQGVC